ncbi:hypothetical protein K438DRAFT_1797494 [Mycena galopus ATCC 62051]|nr:hypothetical protein K438DRAFT_1797494 [Mycena galopus ATCC 62051]
MPSGAHNMAANLLMAEIVTQYQVANNSNMSTVCYPSGTQTFCLTPTRNKQADQSFCSIARPLNSLPVTVVEVGVSESRTQLVNDACWWLETGHASQFSNPDHCAQIPPQSLQLELWERHANPLPAHMAAALTWVGCQRGQPIMYAQPLQGFNVPAVPPLVIPYVDLEINLPNALIVPMDNWTTLVWRQL